MGYFSPTPKTTSQLYRQEVKYNKTLTNESETVDYQNLIRQAVILWVGLCLVLLPLCLLAIRKISVQVPRMWLFVLPVFLLYVCGVVAFTFLPLPTAGEFICHNSLHYPRFFPGWSLKYARQENSTLLGILTSRQALQLLLNTVLFVPLGIFLNLFLRLNFRASLLLGFGTTLLIELTQATGLWGHFECPYRTFDVEDLMANTLGAIIGWALIEAWRLRGCRQLPNL